MEENLFDMFTCSENVFQTPRWPLRTFITQIREALESNGMRHESLLFSWLLRNVVIFNDG